MFNTPPLKKMKMENLPSVDRSTLESLKSFSAGAMNSLTTSSLQSSSVKSELGYPLKPLSRASPTPKKRSREERDANGAAAANSRSPSPQLPSPMSSFDAATAAAYGVDAATAAAYHEAAATAAALASASAATSAHSSRASSRSSSPVPVGPPQSAAMQQIQMMSQMPEQLIAQQLLASTFPQMQHALGGSASLSPYGAAPPSVVGDAFSTSVLDTSGADIPQGSFVLLNDAQLKVYIIDFPKEIRKESSTKKSNIFLKRHAHFRIGVQVSSALAAAGNGTAQPDIKIHFKRPADRTRTVITSLKGTRDSPNQFVYNGDLNNAGMPRSFCKLKKNAKNNIFHLCIAINDEEIQKNYPFEIVAFKRDEKKRGLSRSPPRPDVNPLAAAQKSIADGQKQIAKQYNDKMKAIKNNQAAEHLAASARAAMHSPSPQPDLFSAATNPYLQPPQQQQPTHHQAQQQQQPSAAMMPFMANPLQNLLAQHLQNAVVQQQQQQQQQQSPQQQQQQHQAANQQDAAQASIQALSQQLVMLMNMQNQFASAPAC